MPDALSLVGDDAEDPDRTLVARPVDAERLAHLAVLARREHRQRTRVRGVGEHGAEQHDALDVGRERGIHQFGGEALPAARRLGADQHVQRGGAGSRDPLLVIRGGRAPRAEDRGAGPFEAPHAVVADDDRGPGELVVEVELGVDRGDLDEAEPLGQELRRPGRRLAGVVPSLEGDDEQPPALEPGRLIHSRCPASRPGRPGSLPQ